MLGKKSTESRRGFLAYSSHAAALIRTTQTVPKPLPRRLILIAVTFLLSAVDIALAQAQVVMALDNHGGKSKSTNAEFREVSITADGKKAISGDSEGTIRVWDLSSYELLRTIQIPSIPQDLPRDFCYAFSRDGKFALVGIRNKILGWKKMQGREPLTLWDLNSGAKLRVYDLNEEDVYSVALSPDGLNAVSSSVRDTKPGGAFVGFDLNSSDDRFFINKLRLWSIGKEKKMATLQHGFFGPFAFSPDNKTFFSILKGPSPPLNQPQSWYVQNWIGGTGLNLGAKAMLDDYGTEDAYCIAVAPTGKLLATGNSRGVAMWDLKTGKCSWRHTNQIDRNGTRYNDWPVKSLAFSQDGLKLVAAGHGCGWLIGKQCGRGGMAVLDVETGKLASGFVGTTDFADFVSFTPDGRSIVGASNRPAIGLWDSRTGTLTQTLRP